MENRNSTIFRARWLILISALLLMTGCATSPEVKLASSEMTQAIDEYGQNVSRFQDLWIAEIDKNIDDLGKALVVRAVKQHIESLSCGSQNFADSEWEQIFKDNGLIKLSEEIEHTQDAARNYVSKIMKAKLDGANHEKEDEPSIESGIIEQINKKIVEDTSNALKMLKKLVKKSGGDEEKKDRLIKKIKDEEVKINIASDIVIKSYAEQIISWRLVRRDIPVGLKNLKNVVAAIKTTHQSVDAWIQTDVTVSGEELGGLMDEHANILGLTE